MFLGVEGSSKWEVGLYIGLGVLEARRAPSVAFGHGEGW